MYYKKITEVYIMIIRDAIKNEIYATLNYDVFRFEDFTINTIDTADSLIDSFVIRIAYDEYFFEMTLTNAECSIQYSPGDFFLLGSEIMKLSEFFKFKEQSIHSWLSRIKNDMLNPLEKRFIDNNFQNFREEIENKFCEMEDGYFTKDEGDELRVRLEQLEKMIREKDSQEELQVEISKMKEELEFLKATINTLTKKKWLKSALVKMWSWGQNEENRKLIESGVEAVKAISQMDIPKL